MRTSKQKSAISKQSSAILASTLLGTLLCLQCAVSTGNASDNCDDDVDFKIVTDRTEYSPGSPLRVTALVTNSSTVTLYLFRSVTQCSSQVGSYRFTLIDPNGQTVRIQRCASDLFMDEVDVVHDFADPKSSIALEWRESFGREEEIKLPTKKGVYHLRAEFIPAALNKEQEESLLKHHMRIVRKACKARDAVITIK